MSEPAPRAPRPYDDDWREAALCRRHPDPDLWFAEDPARVASAKLICLRCPVKRECRAAVFAMRPSPQGIWAATTFNQRQHQRAKQKDATMTEPTPLELDSTARMLARSLGWQADTEFDPHDDTLPVQAVLSGPADPARPEAGTLRIIMDRRATVAGPGRYAFRVADDLPGGFTDPAERYGDDACADLPPLAEAWSVARSNRPPSSLARQIRERLLTETHRKRAAALHQIEAAYQTAVGRRMKYADRLRAAMDPDNATEHAPGRWVGFGGLVLDAEPWSTYPGDQTPPAITVTLNTTVSAPAAAALARLIRKDHDEHHQPRA